MIKMLNIGDLVYSDQERIPGKIKMLGVIRWVDGMSSYLMTKG